MLNDGVRCECRMGEQVIDENIPLVANYDCDLRWVDGTDESEARGGVLGDVREIASGGHHGRYEGRKAWVGKCS